MSSRELMIGNRALSTLRVVDLKGELEKRGLSKSGTKKDLVDRLKANIVQEKGKEEVTDSPSNNDEEGLPNIAMQDKLPDDNPFVREYLASQAELFHSQQVVKKLYREEQKRESEGSGASADEREKSPTKAVESFSPPRHDQSPEKRSTPNRSRAASSEKSSENEEDVTENEAPVDVIPEAQKSSTTKSMESTVDEIAHKLDESDENVQNPTKFNTTITSTDESEQPTDEMKDKEVAADVVSEELCKSSTSSPTKSTSEEIVKIPEQEEHVNSPTSSSENETSVSESQSNPDEDAKETEAAVAIDDVSAESDVASTTSSTENMNEEVVVKTGKHEIYAESSSKIAKEIVSPEKVHDQKLDENVAHVSKESVSKAEDAAHDTENCDKKESEEACPLKPASDTIPAEKSHQHDTKEKKKVSPAEATSEKCEKPSPNVSNPKENLTEEVVQKSHKSRGHDKITSKSSSEAAPSVESNQTDEKTEKSPSQSEPQKLNLSDPVPRQPIESRRNSKPIEKENILDEVLDYGEDEVVDLAEIDALTAPTFKTPKPQSAPTKDELSPPDESAPIQFERRVIKIKPNKHSQRRKEKLEEDRKVKKEIEELVITVEFLKRWYPDVKPLTEEELNLEENPSTSPEPDRKLRITRTISNVELATLEIPVVDVESGEEEEKLHDEMDLTIQRKISVISIDDEVVKEQTPPRRAPSQLILVTNLVRPFTVPQLKELLQRTGNVIDLWVDKIKSKCIAKYDTVDEAIETRTALHGVRWPLSNPKSLSVDYTNEERVADLRKKDSGYVEEKPVTAQHVREWDVGKSSPRRIRKRSRSPEHDKDNAERDRKRRLGSATVGYEIRPRRSRSPHLDRKDRNGEIKKLEPSNSGKTLDELFRKTVATPCIYWLPLNPQQIAEKEELRRKRMEERERRIAEIHLRPQR